MSGINKVILVGRVGGEPEIRHVNDTYVVNFSLATSETWKDQHGEKQEQTEWHRIVAWRRLAEIIRDYVGKGDLLYIEGKITTRKWTDREGIERYTTEIVANQMQMLGSRGNEKSQPKQDNAYAKAKEGRAKIEPDLDDDIPF